MEEKVKGEAKNTTEEKPITTELIPGAKTVWEFDTKNINVGLIFCDANIEEKIINIGSSILEIKQELEKKVLITKTEDERNNYVKDLSHVEWFYSKFLKLMDVESNKKKRR